MNKNIAIKGNGTVINGKKIIKIFTDLGANNNECRNGSSMNYYYINGNTITCDRKEDIYGKYIFYESLKEYLNSLNQNINYNDI